jgi:hypothetical protein
VLEGKRALTRLELGKWNHIDGIPRTAFQKRAIGSLTSAKFAPDAKQGINDNTSKRRMIEVRRPIHAVRHRAVLDARRRSGTPRAALIDHGKNVRLALALRRRARGYRRVLDDSPCLKLIYARSAIRHKNPPQIVRKNIFLPTAHQLSIWLGPGPLPHSYCFSERARQEIERRRVLTLTAYSGAD